MKRTTILILNLVFLFFVSASLFSQSITVTNPNGGENWQKGTTHNITWNTGGVSGNIIIKLKKGGIMLGSIAYNIPNTGSYNWNINDIAGAPVQPGNDYRVLIRSFDDHSIQDQSNANFSITAEQSGSIKVTSPNGDENWAMGSSQLIRWNSSGVSGNVIIKLIKGTSMLGSIAWNIPNTGSYSWKINSIGGALIQPGSNYKILVRSFEKHSIEDQSDSNFTIKKKLIKPNTDNLLTTGKCSTLKLNNKDFRNYIVKIFGNASYDVNSCGGRDLNRFTMIYITNVVGPLKKSIHRMHYDFSKSEVKKTEETKERNNKFDHKYRRTKIRACIEDWKSKQWTGEIKNGKYKIIIEFSGNLIKTRAIEEYKLSFFMPWKAKPWNSQASDITIKDYIFKLKYEILLTPTVRNGYLSYDFHGSKCIVVEDSLTGWHRGKFKLPSVEKPKIENYKKEIKDILKKRIEAIFLYNSVKNHFEKILTGYVKTGKNKSCKISKIIPESNSIRIEFKHVKKHLFRR